MSEESDFRDVLVRAAEGGAFDECWDAEDWREACVAKAREIAGDLEGWEIVGVEGAFFAGHRLRPKFLLVPKKETGH